MAAATKHDQFVADIATRDLIGQAKDIQMDRDKIDAQHAAPCWVWVSQHSNRKFRNVAADLAVTSETPADAACRMPTIV